MILFTGMSGFAFSCMDKICEILLCDSWVASWASRTDPMYSPVSTFTKSQNSMINPQLKTKHLFLKHRIKQTVTSSDNPISITHSNSNLPPFTALSIRTQLTEPPLNAQTFSIWRYINLASGIHNNGLGPCSSRFPFPVDGPTVKKTIAWFLLILFLERFVLSHFSFIFNFYFRLFYYT